MPSTDRRRIGPVDTIWLNMDRPNNLMVITSLVFLESVPDWDEVLRIAQTRFVDRYPVFSQRPVSSLVPVGLPYWEYDPDFSLDRHMFPVTLEAPGDDATLQRHVEDCVHRPFDRRHPLWEVQLIDGYGSGAVVFFRIHHSLADGIALTRVLLSLTDGEAGVEDETPANVPADSMVGSLTSTGVNLARQGVSQALRLTTPRGMAETVGQGARATGVVRDLLTIDNPPNVLAGTPGIRKRIVWTRAVPLRPLKHVGKLAGATLNDVLMSAVAGALYRYQVERQATPGRPGHHGPGQRPAARQAAAARAGEPVRPGLLHLPELDARPAGSARGDQAADGLAQELARVGADLRAHHRDRFQHTGPRALRRELLCQQSDWRDDQRRGTTRAAHPGRRSGDGRARLGARLRHPDGGGVHLHVCRDRPDRLHGRCRRRPRPRVAARGVRGRGRGAGAPRLE